MRSSHLRCGSVNLRVRTSDATARSTRPDNADDWAALAIFSPFQNVRPGLAYPPVLYTSSTKDDRVHPAHARKMVAKLEAYGYKPMYYENIEGGHGGAADAKQRAHRDALIMTFLASRLGLR